MSSIVPSPFSRLANGAISGLLSGLAQAISGVKTFAAAIIASAGIQLGATTKLWLSGAENTGCYVNAPATSLMEFGISNTVSWAMLRGTNADLLQAAANNTAVLVGRTGGSSGQIGAKLGTVVADGTVHSSADIVAICTGITGTEVKRGAFQKSGTDGFKLVASVGYLSIDSSVGLHLNWNNVSSLTADTNGLTLTGTRFALGGYLSRASATLGLYATGTSGISETVRAISSRGDSGLKCVTLGTESAAPSDDAILAQFAKGVSVTNHVDAGNGTALARVMASGRVDQAGTDSTGTPGNATINKPTGKSAIAVGAASVVITNSLVTASSRVHITPHARDATCKELIAVVAAGSFTVSGSANATAALPFSWEVSTIL